MLQVLKDVDVDVCMAHLPTFLLSKELSAQLRLQEQHFVVLIPKKLVPFDELSFEFIIKNFGWDVIAEKFIQNITQYLKK